MRRHFPTIELAQLRCCFALLIFAKFDLRNFFCYRSLPDLEIAPARWSFCLFSPYDHLSSTVLSEFVSFWCLGREYVFVTILLEHHWIKEELVVLFSFITRSCFGTHIVYDLKSLSLIQFFYCIVLCFLNSYCSLSSGGALNMLELGYDEICYPYWVLQESQFI